MTLFFLPPEQRGSSKGRPCGVGPFFLLFLSILLRVSGRRTSHAGSAKAPSPPSTSAPTARRSFASNNTLCQAQTPFWSNHTEATCRKCIKLGCDYCSGDSRRKGRPLCFSGDWTEAFSITSNKGTDSPQCTGDYFYAYNLDNNNIANVCSGSAPSVSVGLIVGIAVPFACVICCIIAYIHRRFQQKKNAEAGKIYVDGGGGATQPQQPQMAAAYMVGQAYPQGPGFPQPQFQGGFQHQQHYPAAAQQVPYPNQNFQNQQGHYPAAAQQGAYPNQNLQHQQIPQAHVVHM